MLSKPTIFRFFLVHTQTHTHTHTPVCFHISTAPHTHTLFPIPAPPAHTYTPTKTHTHTPHTHTHTPTHTHTQRDTHPYTNTHAHTTHSLFMTDSCKHQSQTSIHSCKGCRQDRQDGPMDGTPKLVHWTSVVRVRARTSRIITDLLLDLACVHLANMHGTQEKQHTRHSQTGNPRAPVGPASGPTGQVFRPI